MEISDLENMMFFNYLIFRNLYALFFSIAPACTKAAFIRFRFYVCP